MKTTKRLNQILQFHIALLFFSLFLINPVSSQDTDVTECPYFNVFANAAEWATFEQALSSSTQGQMLQRHFATVFDCAFNVWSSEQVVSGS